MSKAYLQFSERYPEAANGYSRVLLGDGTTLADVFDPITGVPISNPVPINADGFVGAYHVENGTVYNIKICGFLGNLVFERESVTVPGDATGTPGTNGKSVRVQAVTGGAQVYDEFGNTVIVLDGEDGEDGTTPVKGVDYFDGINGTTPVKGVDYVDGADGIAGYLQLPALPVDPSTVPIGQPVILPDGTMWTNVTGSWTTLAVSEAMLDAALADIATKDFARNNGNVEQDEWWESVVFRVSRASGTYQNQGGVIQYFTYGGTNAADVNECELVVEMKSHNGVVSYDVQIVKRSTNTVLLYNYYSSGDGYDYLHIFALVKAYSICTLRYVKGYGQQYLIDLGTTTTPAYTGVVGGPYANTPLAGDNSQAIANMEFVGKPSGSVITLSSSQTITPANGAVYYVNGSYDITLSNSPALGTRCYIQVYGTCPQSSKILFTDVAGNSGGVGFGYGSVGAGGVMCERFASGWMVVGGDAP